MSNTKHLADLLKVCSILPALAIMPAMADVQRIVVTPEDGEVVLSHGISGATADTDGGAVEVKVGAQLSINGGVFENNSVYDANNMFGGAIWSYGKLDVDGASFSGNSATSGGAIGTSTKSTGTTIKNSVFANNHALDGGAVSAFKSLSVENSRFENNTAMYDRDEFGNWKDVADDINDPIGGGALALGAESETEIATIVGTIFKDNKSGLNGGAIGTRLAKVVDNSWALTGGKNANSGKLDISATFENNYAKRSGGAIYNTFYTDNGLDRGDGVTIAGVFDDNEAGYRGGAIYNDGDLDYNNKGAVMTVNGATFTDNEAGDSGGAIYNTGVLKINGGVFEDNEAGQWAGAIYNHGSTSTQHASASVPAQAAAIEINNAQFVDNIASVAGGAIYNELGGTVILSGDNLFSGNVANGLANDIHNMGTLNITDGTTSFDGGVTGTGTFTLASDAILELGTATIKQGTIDLYGTVVASMLNDSARGGSYGRFISDDLNVDKGASFKLNVGAAGTYNIWNGKIVDAKQVTVGDIYEIAGIDANGVKIVTKSVADIAEKVGISNQAAGAVAGLANANSGKAHQVSLALQDALDAGDVEYIERETKKLNPTEKPVAQAAASSVQNQVLSLTSGRMAGGISVGRAGGDERSQENGFWIQGLFNKSKFADDFHGYTRGVALGADTLIDNKWTIGGGLAFNNSDVHADGGAHTDISSKTLFLYGQYKPNNWFVNATATYSMSEYTENKTVAGVGLGATYDVDAYGAQIMTGYDFTPGITTEAGLRYLHVAQDDYIDGRDAQIMATDTDFLMGIAGLKYAFAIENDWAIQLRPELRAAMTYDFISDDAATTVVMPGVEAYAVNGERLSRMGGEFGIGLTALYKGMEVSLMYDLDLHKDYTSQTGMIKFRGRF